MSDVTHRTLEFKLYPTAKQAATLNSWLGKCCWFFNRCLEQKIKAYKRRGSSVSFNDQCQMLARMRRRIATLEEVSSNFARDAIRRVDRGMKAFFRRVKAGEKPGFPRFKRRDRYQSMEHLETRSSYILDKAVFIPRLGEVAARGRHDVVSDRQLLIRVLKRASGWYAQVVVEVPVPVAMPNTGAECGIDLGLEAFATLDNGERVENPRTLRKAAKKLKKAQQKLSRRKNGSNRRKKAKDRVARLYERVARRRRGFCHHVSRDLVNSFDRIAVEALNIKGMAKSRFAKSVMDAGWGIFLGILRAKAEEAGREVVEVNPAGTSQECPSCGRLAKKELSERTHRCGCGFVAHRDVAAAMVVRQRAFRPVRGEPVRPGTKQAGSVKRAGSATS